MVATSGTVMVPIARIETFCGHRSPKSNKPCRRAEHHAGRHAFIREHIRPGLVREVWEATCQVCGKVTRDGAVCRACGGE